MIRVSVLKLIPVSLLLAVWFAISLVAEGPVVPRLISKTASIQESSPSVSVSAGDEVLRPYLRGNSVHNWQRGQLGKPTEFWNQKVNEDPVDASSSEVIRYLSYVINQTPHLVFSHNSI